MLEKRSSTPAFSHGDWIQVYVDPDPRGSGPGYIRIEEREGAPGVAILPVRGGAVGLVTIYRRLLGATVLEIPRGFGGEAPDARADAIRELREETGINLPASDLIDLGAMPPNSGILTSRVRLYAALVDEKVKVGPVTDRGEVAEFAWYDLDEVYSRIATDRLNDPFTSSALLRAAIRGLIAPPTSPVVG